MCSKGTYIRALARDLGEALGSGAHLIGLVRTRVGDVTLDRCLSVDDIDRVVAESLARQAEIPPAGESKNQQTE